MDVSSLDRQRLSREKWYVATTVLPGQLTIAFGMFGVVVALPNIIVAFGTDVQTVQWVMTGYLMARVVPMPAMGWLVSRLGRRDLYVLGVLGTTVSTILCGLSWSVESLIVFRVVQGVVGASVMSLGMVMLYEAFPPEQRGLAMGLFIMVASLGPTLGQSVGGYLVEPRGFPLQRRLHGRQRSGRVNGAARLSLYPTPGHWFSWGPDPRVVVSSPSIVHHPASSRLSGRVGTSRGDC